MKKQLLYFFICVATGACLMSCNKESATVEGHKSKLKSVSFSGTQGTSLYQNPNSIQISYNANGSLSRLDYLDKNNVITGTKRFYYAGNKLTALITGQQGDTLSYEVAYLDNRDNIDSFVFGQSPYSLYTASKPRRDNMGQITEVKVYQLHPGSTSIDYVGSSYFEYQNGNVVRSSRTDAVDIFTYEYAEFDNSIDGSPGTDYFFHTKNLISKIYRHTTADPTPILFNTIDYTLDNNNRVVTAITHHLLNGVDTGISSTREFTYY